MHLKGTPTDSLPEVLATGAGDIGFVFISLSARDNDGRDADYIAWHSLDHRPEQCRLEGIRNAMRLSSTPACRAARAANEAPFDKVDHVMTYQFVDSSALPAFTELGAALDRGGRMVHRLPSVGYLTGDLAGKIAAPHAVAGADVIPWRPAHGVYLMIEEGQTSPESLIDVPGVAGIWWYHGSPAAPPFEANSQGKQVTYCYIDGDVATSAALLGERMRQRWASGAVKGLLAAPFYLPVPFDWGRYVP